VIATEQVKCGLEQSVIVHETDQLKLENIKSRPSLIIFLRFRACVASMGKSFKNISSLYIAMPKKASNNMHTLLF
jgi:hypothetical protein